MEAKLENGDDDSFIVLGTSPGSSLDLKCEGILNGHVSLDKIQMEDAMKDLSAEAKSSLKAHFKLGDSPSPASLMVASTIITDDKTTAELQKRFGELLDENIILKETLKQNNDSMKEQFLLIASCQEDMMKTHMLHKEKFDETKELVERLRNENKKLKLDLTRLADGEMPSNGESRSGASSALEFVTSPDDDTINKLTAQLELVEKQRRQVIVDNEKLTWQKESLEHIVDATTKERDELKEKLERAELQLSNKDSKYEIQIKSLNANIHEMQNQIDTAHSMSSSSSEEMIKRESVIRQLEAKVTYLQTELKNAQLKLLNYENIKLEYMRQKSALSDTIKMYKDQIQELKNKLKDTQTITFQPVRLSLSPEPEPSSSSSHEFSTYVANIKMYDKTLKYLSDYLNGLTYGLVDNLIETIGVVASLYDFKLERSTAEEFKSGLREVKQQLEKQHSNTVNNISHVKSTLSIFEGIFNDHKKLLKNTMKKQENAPISSNVETLTSALIARGQELQTLQAEMKQLRMDREDTGVLKAQLDLYKTDFEAEREAREKMACEKENMAADLRVAERRIQDLTKMLDEARKSSARRAPSTPTTPGARPRTTIRTIHHPPPPTSQNTNDTSKTVHKKQKLEDKNEELPRETTPPPQRFRCPVCDKELKTVILLQQHVDSCLL
ncbi:NF-kappa-B essential modulator kenny [Aphomia sociella]